jgi:hypothetical protein
MIYANLNRTERSHDFKITEIPDQTAYQQTQP